MAHTTSLDDTDQTIYSVRSVHGIHVTSQLFYNNLIYNVHSVREISYVDGGPTGEGWAAGARTGGGRRWKTCADWLHAKGEGVARRVGYGGQPSHNRASRDCGLFYINCSDCFYQQFDR